jgi:hypothetical protein
VIASASPSLSKAKLSKAERLLDRVEELARENRIDFVSDPELLRQFWADFEAGRFVYLRDEYTCGAPTAGRHVQEDQGARRRSLGAPLFWDCKNATAALVPAIELTSGVRPLLGLRPGDQVSHAVLGFPKSGARVGEGVPNVGTAGAFLLDPSLWTGMPPLTQSNTKKPFGESGSHEQPREDRLEWFAGRRHRRDGGRGRSHGQAHGRPALR